MSRIIVSVKEMTMNEWMINVSSVADDRGWRDSHGGELRLASSLDRNLAK